MTNYAARQRFYDHLQNTRKSKVICFVTGDRQGMETRIAADTINIFVDHLDKMWPCNKITLVLHTDGGDTAAAWQIVNLLRTFSDELEVLIPFKALSSGTLISLGANRIVMTKQASIGPIDPSLNSPLGPQIPNKGSATLPVSVEAVQGYIDVVTDQLKVTDPVALASIWNSLADKIHPLVLGQIFRTRSQIRNLAKKLLSNQEIEEEKVNEIIAFLCSDSGSHDHTINRREAKDMGLNIEKASEELYSVMRDIHNSYAHELELRDPFRPDILVARVTQAMRVAGQANPAGNPISYSVPRAIVESLDGGSSKFISEGLLTLQGNQITDNRVFEGWKI